MSAGEGVRTRAPFDIGHYFASSTFRFTFTLTTFRGLDERFLTPAHALPRNPKLNLCPRPLHTSVPDDVGFRSTRGAVFRSPTHVAPIPEPVDPQAQDTRLDTGSTLVNAESALVTAIDPL